MMRTIVIIQARMSSTRLPGKVLMDLGDVPVIAWCVRAARYIDGVDEVIVATSQDSGDDVIEAWCNKEKVICVRGPLHDVLARYAMAARKHQADIVMRLTADCPLLDPKVCSEVLQLRSQNNYDYASNITIPRSWPQGLDCEAFTAQALFKAEKEAALPEEREHVTPYIRNHASLFTQTSFACPQPDLGYERWTLDTPHDYDFLCKIAAHYHAKTPTRYTDILKILQSIPEPHNRNAREAV